MALHSRARSLLFVHADRTLSELVPAPPDAVRDFYVDLNNIKAVHPLIVSVDTVSRTETPDGYQQTYRVVDRIPLGPLTIRTSYRARLRVPVRGDVLTEADQSPGVRLRGAVTFEPVDGATRVTERISITAPRPLAGMTIREGVKAHVKMLAGIRRHFESG
ncbi:SRPBCC family protein [Mycobacterium colombiense]|uniref:SRPBCC family protein n=1 Tax=Mycobacterium colombiense TaxID=339268 RepID=UPI00097D79BF|nr:SRPBCC family protein [Mycobacterium colombiense]MCK8647228.1 SRPBCC family protein [Mycobacterium colombiense]